MNGTELALQLLPPRCLTQCCREQIGSAEELRLRIGQPLMLLARGREFPVTEDQISENDLMRTLEKATGASLHTAAPALARGYISYHGLRLGVCGTAVVHEGRLSGFRHVSSLAIRIPRECRGICDGVLRQLRQSGFGNLLILSPPGGGKTTALREIVRCLSGQGRRIGLIDERFEIAASDAGQAQFNLGAHCDVISGVSKSEGAMLLLRGMNPELIAMDEITHPADIAAVREIIGCGVGLIATAHASGPEDLYRRPLYRAIADEQLFRDLLIIRMENGERSYYMRRGGGEAYRNSGGHGRLSRDQRRSDAGDEA